MVPPAAPKADVSTEASIAEIESSVDDIDALEKELDISELDDLDAALAELDQLELD